MYFDLRSFVWFILGFIIFCESKVILNFRIYDYRNPNDIKHDGTKCESFSWLNDLCDPMFQVCVTSKSSCDILNLSINHWKNKKYVYNVLTKEIKMNYMPDVLITEIKVEDHDRYDGHDHIAVFHSTFKIINTQKKYRQQMTVKPANLNVHLYTSITLECEANYYGLKCDNFCEPKINNYKCDFKTGDKICALNCGIHGLCSWNQSSEEYMCSCKSDWTGDRCQSIHYNNCSMLKCNKKCVNDKIKKYCVCNYGPYTEKCTEIFLSKIKTATTKTTTAEIIHNKSTIDKEDIVLKSNFLTNTTPYILLPNGNVDEIEKVSTATVNHEMSKKYKVVTEIQTKKDNKVSDIQSITTTKLFINNNSKEIDTFHYYNKTLGRSAKDREYEKKEASKHKSVLTSQASYSFTTIIIMCILLFLCLSIIALIFVIRNWKNRRIINKKLHSSSFSRNTVTPVVYRPKVFVPKTSSVFSSNSLPQTPQYDYDTCTLQSDCNYETHLIGFPSNLFDENEGIYEEPINENKDSFPYQTEMQGNIDEEVYQEPNKF